MKPKDCTILIALDREHFDEFRYSSRTWLHDRPEMRECPWLVVCDDSEFTMSQWADAIIPTIPQAVLLPVNNTLPRCFFRQSAQCESLVSQREKMLSSLVYAVEKIGTPWFAKIDTDTVSLEPGPFWRNEWFDGGPFFCAPAWSYTKPANALNTLDIWGDAVPRIREFPRLNIPFDPASRLVRSKRIISWLYFGRTDWHRWLAGLCREYGPDGGRLPVASHDTLAYFAAERTHAFYRRVNMKKHGWAHVSGLRKLREIAGRVAG